MTHKTIRCCFLGGQEKDLYLLGEVHKRPDVEIAFVYDPDAAAVGVEIAEILGIPRLTDAVSIGTQGHLDYAVVGEPRERYRDEIELLIEQGVRLLGHGEALEVLCGKPPAPAPSAVASGSESEHYSIEDALTAFERLFDRDKLLEFLLDVAVSASGATSGSIMMYSEQAQELYIAFARGLSERVVRNTRQKLGEGIAGAVAKERRGKLIREAPGDGGLYPTERDRADIRSAISVPLTFDDQLLGVLNVSSTSEGQPLDERGLSALERLSARIARVLSESLKLQETRVRHREMNLRRSVGELTERAISSGTKFSIISNYLAELTGADTVEVFVSTHEGDWLILGGSNRRLSTEPEMVRCDRGAISRAFLERRTIVLTESPGASGARDAAEEGLASSFIFVPLELGRTLGVLMMEFGERHRLDEFVSIKDSATLELARFIAAERREWRLRHEVSALGKVSDAAPAFLTCRSLDDLCDLAARLTADALACERVSVRILGPGGGTGKLARFEDAAHRAAGWPEEDDERFLKLKGKGEAMSLAFLDYARDPEVEGRAYHSLLAVPIEIGGAFTGGIIAYDKRAGSALEDATFTDLDHGILDHIVSMITPVIRGLSDRDVADEATTSYQSVLAGNTQRLRRVIETEMSRADRYHHTFSLLVVKIEPLEALFESDRDRALALVDEATRGIQTRTRKSDFGTWIRRDTFAMLSLEGSKRIRFLVSRLVAYLLKDFSTIAGAAVEPNDIHVGQAVYPGTSRTPEALLAEADSQLRPHGTS